MFLISDKNNCINFYCKEQRSKIASLSIYAVYYKINIKEEGGRKNENNIF